MPFYKSFHSKWNRNRRPPKHVKLSDNDCLQLLYYNSKNEITSAEMHGNWPADFNIYKRGQTQAGRRQRDAPGIVWDPITQRFGYALVFGVYLLLGVCGVSLVR